MAAKAVNSPHFEIVIVLDDATPRWGLRLCVNAIIWARQKKQTGIEEALDWIK